MKETPRQSKLFFLLAAFCILMPSLMKLYTGETQRLIVASGKMTQGNFVGTVIYMFHHGLEGASGVIINRRLPEKELSRIPAFIKDKGLPLYYGGPVDYPEKVIVLGRNKDGTMFSADFDKEVAKNPQYLSELVEAAKSGTTEIRVYIGHAGWGVLQLENEFRMGVWASTTKNPDWVFYTGSPYAVWEKAISAATEKRKPRNPGAI